MELEAKGDATADLASLWRWFGEHQFRGCSPIYERIADAVAGDRQVLELFREAPPAAHLPPAPLGAVRYLLLDALSGLDATDSSAPDVLGAMLFEGGDGTAHLLAKVIRTATGSTGERHLSARLPTGGRRRIGRTGAMHRRDVRLQGLGR